MPRFRFSMWWLMVVITAICVLLFLLVYVGDFVAIVIASLIWCILPTPLVILAIYGRGDWQAFAIGALMPWASHAVFGQSAVTSSLFFAAVWFPLASILCGCIAGVTRRWILANSRDQ